MLIDLLVIIGALVFVCILTFLAVCLMPLIKEVDLPLMFDFPEGKINRLY